MLQRQSEWNAVNVDVIILDAFLVYILSNSQHLQYRKVDAMLSYVLFIM